MKNLGESATIYPPVPENPKFPDIEKQILALWSREEIFKKSLEKTKTSASINLTDSEYQSQICSNVKKEFIFFDGPPFANGLPHYGHILTGFIKDTIGRYKTMLGLYVQRRFGWDCHGLPAEMEAEKELNISGKLNIEKYGIDKFNEYCRKSVLKYTKEWEEYVERQGRWVDFQNDYKTMGINYMESVLWAFKTLYNKGLVYRSMRVMPYSWACRTPVSDFESRLDNSYRQKESKAVTVSFKLIAIPKALEEILKKDDNINMFFDGTFNNATSIEVSLLVWTTTPWTLPSNLALAVNPNVNYTIIVSDKKDESNKKFIYILASGLVKNYEKEIGIKTIGELSGKDLIGCTYIPIFDYFKNHHNAFHILGGDFVTMEDGTGVVHIAPAFGEDDYNLCLQHNIEILCPVDDSGCFTNQVEDLAGKHVFEANDEVIKKLKLQGSWIKTEQYIHNYPHCWRTDTPLIYKAVPSWYLKVTEIKEKMLQNNTAINWIPAHIKDGLFGKWLENARDWSISRNRYWGCPLPIWESDDPHYPHIEVYGSIKELEDNFGVTITDLHKPAIDQLTKPNPSDPTGKSLLRRVPEVLDCWFESGSMPFAQCHYPFENKEWFEKNFPADFIVEYLAQTRGWFYTLMVIATALFDSTPFLNCICHGVILGDDKAKLSKRLKNYVDPQEAFSEMGADSMRWFMLSSPVMRGQEIIIDKYGKGFKDAIKNIIKPLWNAYNFFTIYANIDGFYVAEDENHIKSASLLDQYIISKTLDVVNKVKTNMDLYDTVSSCQEIEKLVDVLNNWYIRRSRDRFWKSGLDKDKISAYNTLHRVLNIICKIAAPLLPMITEFIYRGLNPVLNKSNCGYTDNEKLISVHLEEFPIITASCNNEIDITLVKDMERVMAACTAALSIRSRFNIRVRQPLSKVIFMGVTSSFGDHGDEMVRLVLEETNVKKWVNLPKEKIIEYADYSIELNIPIIAKRLPKHIKELIAAARKNEVTFNKYQQAELCGFTLNDEEYRMILKPKEEFAKFIAPFETNDALVMLDVDLNDELIMEGIARDIVRTIQNARKENGFTITDRISVQIKTSNAIAISAIENWKSYISSQTLAQSLVINRNHDDLWACAAKNSNVLDVVRCEQSLTFPDGNEITFMIELNKITLQ